MKIYKYIISLCCLIINCSFAGIIGNTNNGASTDTIPNGWINASRFIAYTNLELNSISARLPNFPGRVKCAIYSSGRTLLGTSSEITNPTDGWNNFVVSPSVTITNEQDYWLAIWSDDANAKVYYSDMNGELIWQYVDYGVWPSQITAEDFNTFNYCIYGSGANVAPIPTNPPPIVITNCSVILKWDEITNSTAEIGGYIAYYGNASGNYTNRVIADGVTNTQVLIQNLSSDLTYYFVVTAWDTSGLESLPSNEVFYKCSAMTNLLSVPYNLRIIWNR